MKQLNRSICLLLMAFLSTNTFGYCAESIESIWKDARKGGRYKPVSDNTLKVAEVLFTRILNGETSQDLTERWDSLGFKLHQQKYGNLDLLLLREKSDQKYGRGFYLFNRSSENNHLLMSPHSFKDVGTGTIGRKMFLENEFGILAQNTVARYVKVDNQKSEIHDLAKLPDSYFVALTRAFLTIHKNDNIYQLHGFDQLKRTSIAGSSADLILSGGTKTVRQDIQNLQSCLQGVLGKKVRIYPTEVKELGGTTNIVGKILRKSHHSGFFHVELNKKIRDALRKDISLRKAIANCLEKQ